MLNIWMCRCIVNEMKTPWLLGRADMVFAYVQGMLSMTFRSSLDPDQNRAVALLVIAVEIN